MRVHSLNEEVLVADGPVVEITGSDIAELKRRALGNPRRRIRVCAHPDTADPLHEMLIVHTEGAYIRPHKHLGKSESVHVLEGEADVVLFDDEGEIDTHIPIGPYDSDRRFFFRIDEPAFHTLLIASEFLVMHEVTNGPFLREQTVFAPWAPDEADAAAAEGYRRRLAERLAAANR